jgi:hypothetical protein
MTIYSPKHFPISIPKFTHPQRHYISANVNLVIPCYIPIQYNTKFSPYCYPWKSYSIGEFIPVQDDIPPKYQFIKLSRCIPTSYCIILYDKTNGRIVEYDYYMISQKATRRKGFPWIIWRFEKQLFCSYCC